MSGFVPKITETEFKNEAPQSTKVRKHQRNHTDCNLSNNQALQILKNQIQSKKQKSSENSTLIKQRPLRFVTKVNNQISQFVPKRELSLQKFKGQPSKPVRIPEKELFESKMITQTKDSFEVTSPNYRLNEDSSQNMFQNLSLGDHNPTFANLQPDDDAYMSRNTKPIPAYTSLECQEKLRYKSEERYVNEQMEVELEAYKVEIEKRFQESTINKCYQFPRVLLEKTKVQQLENNQLKPILKTQLSNGSLIQSTEKENSIDYAQSPYGHFVNLKKQGNNHQRLIVVNELKPQPINDYKKILSRFLSSSLSCTNQNNAHVSTQAELASSKSKTSIRSKNSSTSKRNESVKKKGPDSVRDNSQNSQRQGVGLSRLQTICEKLNLQRDVSNDNISTQLETNRTPINQINKNQQKNPQTFEYSGFNTSRNPQSIGNVNHRGFNSQKTFKIQKMNEDQSKASEYYKTFISITSDQDDRKQFQTENSIAQKSRQTSSNPFSPQTTRKKESSIQKLKPLHKKQPSHIPIPSQNQKLQVINQQKKVAKAPQPINQFKQMQINLKALINHSQKCQDSKNHSRVNSIKNSQKPSTSNIQKPLDFLKKPYSNKRVTKYQQFENKIPEGNSKSLASTQKNNEYQTQNNVLALKLQNNNIVVVSRPVIPHYEGNFIQDDYSKQNNSNHVGAMTSQNTSNDPYKDSKNVEKKIDAYKRIYSAKPLYEKSLNLSASEQKLNDSKRSQKTFIKKYQSSSSTKQSSGKSSQRDKSNNPESMEEEESDKRDFKVKCMKIDLYKQAQMLKGKSK